MIRPYPVTLLPIGSGYFRSQTFSRTPTFSNLDILHTYPTMKMEEIVFRNVGI